MKYFTITLEERSTMLCCQKCGALVDPFWKDAHDEFHKKIEDVSR